LEATYIAQDNLDAAECFLVATEETFQLLGRIAYKFDQGKCDRFSLTKKG
jgi:hypothetical protein